jgi:hypothetical protein
VDWAFDRERAEKELLELIETVKELPPDVPEAEAPEDTEAEGQENEENEARTEETPVVPVSENRREYVIWQEQRVLDQEDFYLPAGKKIIKKQIAEIIEQEAPIYEHLLRRRITQAWGFSRAGLNIQKVSLFCRKGAGAEPIFCSFSKKFVEKTGKSLINAL